MKKTFEKDLIWLCIPVGILLGLILKLFIIDFLHISGHSMEPTLASGDSVLVFRLAYGIPKPFRSTFFVQWSEPDRNDVIIFFHDNKIVIKRCAAVAGDRLDFSYDSGYILTVNNISAGLSPDQYAKMKSYETVPEGYVLALGDNPSDSIDSRDYGFVSVKNITGKVLCK
ncbi:MAG: signal peptidase I [Treponema sp.]|nr:signal peptidase I [Treponema sp.]